MKGRYILEKGYLSLILHAHLPYIRHPEYDTSLEEHWLYEAITETYIPLLDVFEGLIRDNINFRVTFSLTPPLIAMLSDPLLQERYRKYLYQRIELAEKEVDRTRYYYQISEVSRMYLDRFHRIRELYDDKYGGNIISEFKRLQDMGKIEIIACPATHGFFPLMEIQPEAVFAQVSVGINIYRKAFGSNPKGIWLAECGYTPVADSILKDHNILYTVLETHGVLYASPRPVYGTYAPVCTPNGIAVFGRDRETSKQVWSADEGYPGDFNYRDFYRDIGYELDLDYIRPYILPDGQRMHTGLKYYKITGKTENKHAYVPEKAIEKAAEHAGNFMFNREHQIKYIYEGMEQPPIIVCPYDAELFGHWWYEGIYFLDSLFRKVHHQQNTFSFINPNEYLDKYPKIQVVKPAPSSWGYQGYNEVWLNGSNDWIYRHIHHAGDKMISLSNQFQYAEGIQLRALNQAARELLLAQSSDWAFIMKAGTMVEYAKNRTKAHISRFLNLCNQIESGMYDENWLSEVEYLDNIFPDIHYSIFQSRNVGKNNLISNMMYV
jgi:1,4-alpha-glucan branching enzyme